MIEPIVLTSQGDKLELRKVDKRTELSRLIVRYQDIGRHNRCWGQFFFQSTSESHDAIICQQCGLRVTMTRLRGQDMTYHGLRRYFSRRPGPMWFRFKSWVSNMFAAKT